ncbi:MAG TPA: glycosyltransferase [Pyrinomonadaceae bacterium]|nr:glycosyltransferase [Pyrinomonadaceae bacterium]
MKKPLSEKLALSTKLRLKRAGFAPLAWALRLGARAYNFAARVAESAEANGLDLRRAWDVPATPRAPSVAPFSASDFLFLARAGARTRGAPVDGPRANDRGETAVETPQATSSSVKTSIVIPVFNKAEFTFQCLRSLIREVDFDDTEVIVVNNASTDETREMLSHFDGFVRVIDNDTNRGFVDACNQGAAAARGRFLVFLNNDTVVLPGWLENLVETIESDERAGAVGSLFLYPDGRIQEAGAIVWSNGEAFHYGWGRSPEDRRFAFAREVDYCSGASLLVRKDLFDRLGGFDRRYAPAYYEDTDICMGVRSLGFKVVYQPRSRLVHYEGATAGTDTRTGFKRFQVVNREKFYEKWRDTLAREHQPFDPSKAERAANRKWDTQVVVFDDRMPSPDRDAGSIRMLFILRALKEWCHPVFVTTAKRHWPEYERLLWKEGVETAGILELPRLAKARRFRAAVASRPEVAAAVVKQMRRADPRVKFVFDMVDAHFIRFAREAEVTGDDKAASEAARYRKMETRLARASDLVWCNSAADKEATERAAPGVPSFVVPTVHRTRRRGLAFEEREHLLFVGNFLHRPNVDGVRFFVNEVLPAVRESLPGVELHLVGDNAPAEFAGRESEGVRVLGYVPDIEPLFARARVFVAPIRFGAGVKGKVGEALAHAVPVVTTEVGAEGMFLRDGEEALVVNSAEEFAAAVVRLYGDAALWRHIAGNAHAHVERNFSPRVVGDIINGSIKKVLGETNTGNE